MNQLAQPLVHSFLISFSSTHPKGQWDNESEDLDKGVDMHKGTLDSQSMGCDERNIIVGHGVRERDIG